MSQITINGVSLDPAAPQVAGAKLIAADANASNYLLVQVNAPLTAAQKAQLAALHVDLLEYVPECTYICRYDPHDLVAIRALPFVAWANTYMKGFKIAPSLHAAADGPQASYLQLHDAIPHAPQSKAQLVDVVLHRDVSPPSVMQTIARASGIDAANLKPARGKFRIRVQADRLPAIAAIDQVRSVEEVKEKQLWNNIARGLIGADTVQASSTLEGAGQIVAVADTGFDLGTTNPAQIHSAFVGRVKKLFALGRSGLANDPDGHGTHVCGSVLGDGTSTTLGNLKIRGTAPKAQLVMQSLLDANNGLGGLPDDLHQLFDPPYNEGARVHSNSWGDGNNAYTQEAHDVDAYVWEHRDLVVVIAAGNEGIDADRDGSIDPHSVGSPGTARNCITVGASENQRPGFKYTDGIHTVNTYGDGWPDSYPVPPIFSDLLANSDTGLAAFSSRGPTRDGRIKPDVVAPGTGILSTRSRASGVGPGWGLSADPDYYYEGGTSMATPLVAGCAAVVREYLTSKGLEHPSAALVKAVLINGAEALSGQYTPSETGVVPNVHQGFGRVNLVASVDHGPETVLFRYWDEDQALETNDEQTMTVSLPTAASMLKVTLVWTDAPGETLQNDLDLTVTVAGFSYLGNAAPGSKTHDRKNNVEQVAIAAVPAGTVKLTVKAHRIAMYAQSYALVVRATT